MFGSSDNERFWNPVLDFGHFHQWCMKTFVEEIFVFIKCVSPGPLFFLYPCSFIPWSSGFATHAPVNWKQIKKSQKNSMKTSEFRFLKASLLHPTNSLFSIANIHSHSSTKTASWHELAKFSYPKPILWLRKVDFEKLGPILSSHISADAPFHAEFEFVLAFEEKCLARPIINHYWPNSPFSASSPRAYHSVRGRNSCV